MTLSLGACSAQYQGGQQPLDAAKINSIERGKTLRAEVEAALGPPTMVGMGANGERYAIYHSYQYASSSKSSVNPAILIPIVGSIYGSSAQGQTTTRQQTLQVLYTAGGVVKDYEFSDNMQNTTTSGNLLNTTITSSRPEKH